MILSGGVGSRLVAENLKGLCSFSIATVEVNDLTRKK